MNFFVDLLERLDNFFKGKKATEAYIIISLPIMVIAYVTYEFAIPLTQERYDNSYKRLTQTEKTIAQLEKEMNRLTVNGDKMYRVKELESEIKNLKTTTASLNDASDYIDAKMVAISDILFNRESWSEFLDSITQKAKDNKIKIQSLENRFLDQKGEFGHVLEISVAAQGEFKNMISFLATIEQSELLVDIYAMDMNASKKIDGKYDISVWGFNK